MTAGHHMPSHHIAHHTTPHHTTPAPHHTITYTTPHHIAAPQREFVSNPTKWNMYASWACRGQSTNTNTNTIPNDGNDILAKVQTQPTNVEQCSSRSVWSLSVPTIGSSTRALINGAPPYGCSSYSYQLRLAVT
jgi:hypothetical protein